MVQKDKIKPIKEMIHIEYEYRFKSRYLDTSNCSVMNKAIEDGLVESGVLVDDTPQYITSSTTYVPIVGIGDRRKMEYDKVIVTIYEVGIAPLSIGDYRAVVREKAKGKKRTGQGEFARK